MKKLILILTIYLISTISANAEFSFTFEWGDIKKCTSGNPNRVENPIAKYYSALTDYGNMIKFSDIIHPKNSNMFAEFDDYINIKKEDLKSITFEQLLFYLKNIEPKEKQSKKDCLIQLLDKKQIKYDEGLWDEAV